MNHFAAPSFWDAYDKLPKSIRMKADGSFAKLRADPFQAGWTLLVSSS
ncbi:hypothetical protein MPL3356_330019 [Mesorhizobium plurifarium]|uniref:Uncharacterized protein n=1 Tax=Mesorhizobium plurifarium TaxID=69974 RepID=A0A090DUP6_MESPL|nr:hypothetical protein MPL3356_330019 [Mesorhizobium plurifarium]